MVRKYERIQISLNPENKFHMQLLKWIDDQSPSNRADFAYDSIVMRYVEFMGNKKSNKNDFAFEQYGNNKHKFKNILED